MTATAKKTTSTPLAFDAAPLNPVGGYTDYATAVAAGLAYVYAALAAAMPGRWTPRLPAGTRSDYDRARFSSVVGPVVFVSESGSEEPVAVSVEVDSTGSHFYPERMRWTVKSVVAEVSYFARSAFPTVHYPVKDGTFNVARLAARVRENAVDLAAFRAAGAAEEERKVAAQAALKAASARAEASLAAADRDLDGTRDRGTKATFMVAPVAGGRLTCFVVVPQFAVPPELAGEVANLIERFQLDVAAAVKRAAPDANPDAAKNS